MTAMTVVGGHGVWAESPVCKLNMAVFFAVPPCCGRVWCVCSWTAVGHIFCLAVLMQNR